MCISDYWIGCDRTKPLKLKVGSSPWLLLAKLTSMAQVGKLAKSERQKSAADAGDQASDNSDGEDEEDADAHSEPEKEAADDDDLTVRLPA